VTAALIEAARRRQPPPPDREQLAELMKEMSARLAAIEARLEEQGSQAGD
jgi:glutathione S-transferase